MIQDLLSSGHPQINLTSLYTFLWCLWKSRNDCLFNRKCSRPSQVSAISNAIVQGFKLEDTTNSEDQPPSATATVQKASTLELSVQTNFNPAGDAVFCDAAWEPDPNSQPAPAGIGVFIQQMGDNQHCRHLFVSALSPPASTPWLRLSAFFLPQN
jgi:hypothetical protein